MGEGSGQKSYPTEWGNCGLEAVTLGVGDTSPSGRAQAEPLLGNAARGVAEPRPGSICLANPQTWRLRRLRAWHARVARLDDGRRASVHGAPGIDAAEYGARARSGTACRCYEPGFAGCPRTARAR